MILLGLAERARLPAPGDTRTLADSPKAHSPKPDEPQTRGGSNGAANKPALCFLPNYGL
jgi:hypothetical protein